MNGVLQWSNTDLLGNLSQQITDILYPLPSLAGLIMQRQSDSFHQLMCVINNKTL